MNNKISYLTIDKLKNLIISIVHTTMEDFLEDLRALSSEDYVNSIREAREDFKAGDSRGYSEVFY